MPKIVDHEERRAAIAIGVITVMAEHGIAGVSLRTVARAAGASMGSVQHYFATKAELVRLACSLFVEKATQQHRATEDAPPEERIRNLLMLGIPGAAEQRTGTAIWHEFVIAGVNDAAISDIITNAWQQRRLDLIEQLKRIDTLRRASDGELADLLAATADGLAVRAILGDLTRDQAHDALLTQLAALNVSD
ncbi:TetR/AcrR family transcriptional regulator [Paramicrobacterium chengjingii]|uniref:TetR family transcriptional regulator C-terminal domain-containing protein n=1 Tax=Paramicrobacterium chengjingii TaxID=2769067 RepID=A0ABX6YM87_9MICO|nr:TetR family transcriptional regulator C-terminal domain-containing protein [Microbacterium chengjingii]QPZ39437.1 TetR family transcriptional regulator C-terminal domain-containing protein [Microbacterium chengjingii]